MPRADQERIELLDELHSFFDQSNISSKNLQRLVTLSNHDETAVSTLAALILDIARVLPGKRNRWLKLAQRRPLLFARAVELFGVEYFEDALADHGNFESPLWRILEKYSAKGP